jgi:hypothetical protein
MLQNKEIYYEWTEVFALFGVASILTAIISIFITI